MSIVFFLDAEESFYHRDKSTWTLLYQNAVLQHKINISFSFIVLGTQNLLIKQELPATAAVSPMNPPIVH